MKDAGISRRTLLRLGLDGLLGGGALLVLGAGLLRSAYPRALPGGRRKVRIGEPGAFAPGTAKYFEEGRFFVFGDERGIWAVSAVCTHLGCVVRQDNDGFICPCHGSRFDSAGAVTHGPAPKGLPWLAVESQPDGRLVVDAAQTVPTGTKAERNA
jgi:cytochrome b6-f complex iron-sulfur subunit